MHEKIKLFIGVTVKESNLIDYLRNELFNLVAI